MLKEGAADIKIIDYTTWADGDTGSAPGFSDNGSGQSRQIYGTDPWGRITVVWEAVPTGNDSASGGWTTPSPYINMDNTKLYRFSYWVNRTVQGGTTPGVDEGGAAYFGFYNWDGSSNILATRITSAGTTTNPYFWSTSNPPESQLPTGEWILVVGHVWPHDTTVPGSNHPDSGRYRTSGFIANISYDYKWNVNATRMRHRSYLYYNEDATARQRWCYPRIDLVDGSEPSINDLLTGGFYEALYFNHIGKNKLIYSPNFSEVGPVDGLIGYWPMNGNLLDYGGSGNDGTASGATVVGDFAPRDKYCYEFLTSTDKVELQDSITLSAGSAWSWSFWGYKTAYGSHGIGGNQTTGANGRLSFNSSTELRMNTTGTDPTISVSAFPNSTWFHFVITHTTGDVVTVYRDGSSVGTADSNPTGNIIFNRIGDNPDDSGWISFTGHMFDFRIYNKVLSIQEINILSKTFDTDAANRTEMEIAPDTWYTFGQFKEQL